MKLVPLGLALALATQGCSLVVDTRCFQGECPDASFDANVEASIDAAPDVRDASPDVVDAGMEAEADVPDANDVCFQFAQDPCRNVPKGYGGCYCGTSTQSGFDSASAKPDCIYRCNDTTSPAHTDSAKACAASCVIAPAGTEDYCSGKSACTGTVQYCYDTCTQ